MKKYILKRIKDCIEDSKYNWAKNYVSMVYQETLDTPEAQKQVAAAKHHMQEEEKTIAFLEKLYKKEALTKK